MHRSRIPLQVRRQSSILLEANPAQHAEPAGVFTHELAQRRIGDRTGYMKAPGSLLHRQPRPGYAERR